MVQGSGVYKLTWHKLVHFAGVDIAAYPSKAQRMASEDEKRVSVLSLLYIFPCLLLLPGSEEILDFVLQHVLFRLSSDNSLYKKLGLR